MKQKNKKIIAIAIIALVILAGIVVVNIWGFNKELRYAQSQSIDINVEQQVDVSKVKNIANEILGLSNMVQTIEIYEDTVSIRANSISEEQKNNIVNKLKETYEFEQTADKVDINTVPATRIRDMYKQYVFPIAISAIVVVIYMAIRYYKKGILKVVARTVAIPLVAQLLFFSIVAITRIPMGRFIPTFVILVYIASVMYIIKINEK